MVTWMDRVDAEHEALRRDLEALPDRGAARRLADRYARDVAFWRSDAGAVVVRALAGVETGTMTRPQAAAVLGVSRHTISPLVASGTLRRRGHEVVAADAYAYAARQNARRNTAIS